MTQPYEGMSGSPRQPVGRTCAIPPPAHLSTHAETSKRLCGFGADGSAKRECLDGLGVRTPEAELVSSPASHARSDKIGPGTTPPVDSANVAPSEAWIGSAPTPEQLLRTITDPWDEIDDGFNEARGITLAVSIGAVLLVGGFIVGMMLK